MVWFFGIFLKTVCYFSDESKLQTIHARKSLVNVFRPRVELAACSCSEIKTKREKISMANVFICHRKADVILAERLSQEIKSAGHEIWLDDWKIDLGDSIDLLHKSSTSNF